ncbi:MAG TPA: HAMP domain-containing protein [Anaerolineae bacterium]|nr:HAMP domain-containing protein [Anaerolineae bacterium]
MNRLRTRFGLALVSILVVATTLPVLTLYLLSASGLIEATYVTDSRAASRESTPDGESTQELIPTREAEIPLEIPRSDPETQGRVPYFTFNSDTGRLVTTIPADLQRMVFTSPIFKLRIDLPAWVVLVSLPITSLLIGILMSVLMSRSVTRPILQLAEATRIIGQRDLSFRVETQGSQEIQELADAFNRMADDLERAERARRNLMADMAHELRTPLAVLEGNLRAMLDGVRSPNEEEIGLLFEQTHHLKRLASDLGELSAAESDQLPLNRTEVDLAPLVQETLAHFNLPAQEQGIAFHTDISQPLMHPALDENRIRQVLHNLLSNAFNHTSRGGRITISARQQAAQHAIEIDVTDTGVGISKENLPHIFNRFYRVEASTARDRGGVGLGLAIVKAIVEAHGGSVRAQSDGIGHGSTFIVTFPLTS